MRILIASQLPLNLFAAYMELEHLLKKSPNGQIVENRDVETIAQVDIKTGWRSDFLQKTQFFIISFQRHSRERVVSEAFGKEFSQILHESQAIRRLGDEKMGEA